MTLAYRLFLIRAKRQLFKKKAGDTVNLENDIVGKYIERFMRLGNAPEKEESTLTMDMLREFGI